MNINVKAGMFHLVRGMSRDTVKSALNRADNYLTEFGGYPSTGLYNAMGVLQFKLGEEEDKKKATDSFGMALDQDPFNLNAWENSKFVYETLGLVRKLESFSQRTTKTARSGRSDVWPSKALHTFSTSVATRQASRLAGMIWLAYSSPRHT